MRLLRRLRDNERGFTAVEFALISIPLFTLLMGSIEFGLAMFAKASTDGALKEAARMATTGDVAITGVNGANIDAMVTRKAKVVKSAQVTITKQFYDRFDQIRQPEQKTSGGATPPYCFKDDNRNQTWDLDPGQSGMGGADDIINYKVSVSYRPLFPLVTNWITGEPNMTFSSEVSLRNEPFANGSDVVAKTCCVSGAAGNPVTCT
jgi:hypothetical protein